MPCKFNALSTRNVTVGGAEPSPEQPRWLCFGPAPYPLMVPVETVGEKVWKALRERRS